MATDKRQRQKQGRQERLEAERASLARTRRNRSIRNAIIFAVVVVVAAFVLSRTGGKGKTESLKSDASSSTTKAPSSAKAGNAAVCPPTDGTAKRTLTFTGSLKQCLTAGRTFQAVLTTSLGQVEVALDTKRTPRTTNAFVSLSRWKYYDGTKLFRTEKDSGIIQGGSPHTQSNADQGPGFTIADEGGTFTSADYGPGTLAMARSAQPNSANGQFFLLSGEGAKYLGDKKEPGAGTYVVFGKVTKGLDVLKRIASLDDGGHKPPASKAPVITKVQITET